MDNLNAPARGAKLAREVPLLPRREAVEYLRREWGLPVGNRALAKQAHHRRGPPYSLILGTAFYRPADLDNWVLSKLNGATA